MHASENAKGVLFICKANVCRSPMSEAIFNALASDKGARLWSDSAGVTAPAGTPMAPNAVQALRELGIHGVGHGARQVSQDMLEEADLVLAMSPRQVAELSRLSDGSSGHIYTLPQYATGASGREAVPDPYGLSLTVYRAVARQLLSYMEPVIERIQRGVPPLEG